MLPSILAKQLQKGIGDYIETTFPMTNMPFKGSIQKMMAQKDSVYHEPYMAVHLPFRAAEEMPTCFEAIHPPYFPYVHQQKAFERLTGDDGRSTLIATGTGSGKTECFLYPILEYCYQHRGERGIKALIIYPMNALATDQAKRIAELIYESDELRGNVNVGMYVGGQEKSPSRRMSEHGVITDHETMLNSAPDILMTNYKMLDYLLVRPKDALLWRDNGSETLKYIAVDELHTFDGAQGTDLACLLRRLKRRLGIYDGYLCCIGTSATMGSKDHNSRIIEYASEIFGEPFEKDSVITEDRLSASEFFGGSEITEFAIPEKEALCKLEELSGEDDFDEYIKFAVSQWFPALKTDALSDEGRIELGKLLMHHGFMQSMIILTRGNYYQAAKIAEELSPYYPELKNQELASVLINSLKSFVVVEGEDELRKIMSEPLEKWRVFLHPTQRRIVRKNYSGAARVLGGAGTGKTVVAMHRAKQLASSLSGENRILFTTFTANLAADIRENLKKICTLEELRQIEVIHLDAWVNQFLRESGFSAQIGYDEEIMPLWEKAVLMANNDLPFDIGFYVEEWNRIVVAQEALSMEKYVKAARNGRGTRLDRKKRMAVWKVFENYQNLMKENQVRDINTAMYECTKLLMTSGMKPRYEHIIVDEGQDFSDNAYRLIRTLAGTEHENDIFVVGDSHQRIYRNRPTLSKCGIHVRGRSSILKINYRTTEEIRKYAFALLSGNSFDDLDEGGDLGDQCQSLTHGEKPLIRCFKDANAEFEYLSGEI